MELNRREMLGGLFVGAASYIAGLIKEGSPDESAPLTKEELAQRAREELEKIINETQSLRNYLPNSSYEPLFYTKEQISPEDAQSIRAVVIDPARPTDEQLQKLESHILSLNSCFGRMDYDLNTEGPHTTAFSKEDLERVGAENIIRGATIQKRFEIMLDNARRGGIIVQSPTVSQAATFDR